MEQVFINLEKINKLIQKKPQEFEEVDSNVIFDLLENNDYETVINRIRKNLVPSDDPDNLDGGIIVPDSPLNGEHNGRSDISYAEDTNGANGGHQDGARSKNNRKRKRSESDLLPSPGRPKNGEAAMDEAARPLNAEDLTFKDEMLSNLLEIFPDKKPAYLKNVISANAGLQVNQLVAILLDQNIDVNNKVNTDNLNGENRRKLQGASNNHLVEEEVVVVSDDDDILPRTVMDITSSTPKSSENGISRQPVPHRRLNGTSSLPHVLNGISTPPVTSTSLQPQPVPSSQSINQVPVITNVQNLGIVAEPVIRLPEPDIPVVAPEHNDVANVTIDLGAGPGETDDEAGPEPGHEAGHVAPMNGEHQLVLDNNEPAAGPSNNQNTSDKDSTLCTLLNYFPHVDPSYLQKTASEIGNCQTKLQHFIENNVGSADLPNRKEYDAKMAKKSAIDKVKNMTVSDFLKEFENPEQSFNDIASTVSESYKKSCTEYINSKFSYLTLKARTKILKENNHHLLPCVKKLKNIKNSKRKAAEAKDTKVPMESLDLAFFKDYIYMKLEPRIQEAIRQNEDMRKQRIDEARANGALFECQCCYDEECLLIEVCMCVDGHMFCRDCVRRGSEVQIGDNKTRINCLQDCQAEIELRELEKVLRPTIYTRLVERQANEDLMKANVENLVQCPACNFAVIIPESEKLIKCESSECGKVSCKECKEENHLPLRCDEVEKDDEVKARTKLENAMAEAMIRECPKCKNRFVKSDGCNKMQCNKCKTIMCYLCKQVISNDYKHFYGHGATPKKTMCPLWSDNDTLHKSEVAKAADETKKELGDNAAALKHDPTAGMERPPEGFDKKKNRALPGGAGVVRHNRIQVPRFPNAMIPGFAHHDFARQGVGVGHMLHHLQHQQILHQQQQMLQNAGARMQQIRIPHPQVFHQVMPPQQAPRPPPIVPGVNGRAGGGFNRIMQNIGMGDARVMDYIGQDIEALANNQNQVAVEVRRFEGEVRRFEAEAREAERAQRIAAQADRDLARAMRHVMERAARAPAAQPGTPGHQERRRGR